MKKTLFYFMIILISTSCTRYKDLVYLQEKGEDVQSYTAKPKEYRIQKRDVLYINIISLNNEITEIINATNTISNTQFNNDASMFIYGYNVNDSGMVEIPIIGKVLVINNTIEEAKRAIEAKARNYINDATIVVKIISFKYSVIGEVNRPGVFLNHNSQLTVLEAISNAGDISSFGDRKQVMVIRPGNNGTETFQLDLTSAAILNSDGFFLLPNDIVYIKPVKSYNFRVNMGVYSFLFTGISTLILVLNFMNNN